MKYLFLSCLCFFACGDSSKATVGESCKKGSDCESRLCLQELNGPFGPAYPLEGGLCTNECTWNSEGTTRERSTGTCEDGEVCLQYAGGDRVCFLRCEEDSDCRDNWSCYCVSYDCVSSEATLACIPNN